MIWLESTKGQHSRVRKLSSEQILDIRKRYDKGEPVEKIAKRYGISERYTVSVGKRQVWKSLKDQ